MTFIDLVNVTGAGGGSVTATFCAVTQFYHHHRTILNRNREDIMPIANLTALSSKGTRQKTTRGPKYRKEGKDR